jgi:hypothetical protein
MLLRQQLEVLERLQGRAEVAADQRARLLDMLRSLWAAVRELRIEDAGAAARGERAEALRTLCSRIQGTEVRTGAAGTLPSLPSHLSERKPTSTDGALRYPKDYSM